MNNDKRSIIAINMFKIRYTENLSQSKKHFTYSTF